MLSDRDGQVQVSQDGRTVWVHAEDGSTVGRFSSKLMQEHHGIVLDQSLVSF